MINLMKSGLTISRLANRLTWIRLSRVGSFSIRNHNQLVHRTKNYNQLNEEHVKQFKMILGEYSVKTEDLNGFNVDWLGIHQGEAKIALLPSTSDQLSEILSFCTSANIHVVIQGGNTGLVAGGVPIKDEVVINMQKMNRVLNFDSLSGVLECEAGCVLQTLDEFVGKHGYQMPLDLGAKGSCQIGGNLATNAGGLRVIRYGTLHGSCLGLEVILMDGRKLDLMSSLRKDNTGYDLKQLFIGSEGTLGVITKCSILCPQKPKATLVGVLSISSFERLLQIFRLCKEELSEQLSAFEMMDQQSMQIVCSELKTRSPFEGRFYTLIELAGGNLDDLERRFSTFLEKLEQNNLLEEGTYSTQESTMQKLWELRERVAEALLRSGYCFKYDLSLPLVHFYDLVELMRTRLKDNPKVTSVSGYGHVGDSNLHLTVTADQYDQQLHDQIEPFVYEWVQSKRGSVSAEHGLGLKKNAHMHFSKSQSAIELMKQLKLILDPNGFLNPDKMFKQVNENESPSLK